MLSVAWPPWPKVRLPPMVQFEFVSCMLTVPLEVGLLPMKAFNNESVEALLMRRSAVELLPIMTVVLGVLVVMSKGVLLMSVMSVFIVVPGFRGSSMPTIMPAFVVGVRRSVVRSVAVDSFF